MAPTGVFRRLNPMKWDSLNLKRTPRKSREATSTQFPKWSKHMPKWSHLKFLSHQKTLGPIPILPVSLVMQAGAPGVKVTQGTPSKVDSQVREDMLPRIPRIRRQWPAPKKTRWWNFNEFNKNLPGEVVQFDYIHDIFKMGWISLNTSSRWLNKFPAMFFPHQTNVTVESSSITHFRKLKVCFGRKLFF